MPPYFLRTYCRWFKLCMALYKGRPCIPVEEIPPRLYHRTVEDAAFAILDDRLVPGFGSSGKAHCYFSSLPLQEMTNQAGVRRDLPVEVVFETAAVLKHAYLSRRPARASSAGRRCQGVQSSTSGTPSRTGSCTPGSIYATC